MHRVEVGEGVAGIFAASTSKLPAAPWSVVQTARSATSATVRWQVADPEGSEVRTCRVLAAGHTKARGQAAQPSVAERAGRRRNNLVPDTISQQESVPGN